MTDLFLHLFNMSITAGWIVLVVVILRVLLKKAPKWTRCVLWALVGIRLLCPFSVESVLSLIPSAETIPADIAFAAKPQINSGIPFLNNAVNPVISEQFAPDPLRSVNPMQVVGFAASAIWVIGIVCMLLYAAVSYGRLRIRTREGVETEKGIWLCDRIESPFILGVIRPRIFMPSNMAQSDMEYVLAHEKAHLKRRDHWWKPLGFILLTVYWFNPLIWGAYILLCRDIELACDEKVIRDMSIEHIKSYSNALINCSVPRRMIAACPLAFGEIGVKGRIKSVLNYKKPAFWIVVVAVIACIAVSVFFLTDPPKEEETPSGMGGVDGPTGIEIRDDVPKYFVEGDQLTLEYVLLLSEKGNKLTWTDFENFTYTEMGSGLYIRRYVIDEMFTLCIGGTDPKEEPLYFYLRASDAWDEMIDIRENDVQKFVDEHKNNPVVKKVSYDGYYTCPVDNTGDNFSNIIGIGGIPPHAYISSISSLASVRIESVEQLEKFKEKMDSSMDFRQSYPDAPSFADVSREYTKEYFEETTLVLVYVSSGTTANRYSLEYATTSLGVLSLGLLETSPEVGDTAMQGWLVCIDIPKDQMQDIETIDARISTTVYPDKSIADEDVIAAYVHESPIPMVGGSLVRLYDNGKFTFSFSWISSYIGFGDYEIDGDRLALRTDDGEYHYVFTIVDEGIMFDAEASSEKLWYSGLSHGAILKTDIYSAVNN